MVPEQASEVVVVSEWAGKVKVVLDQAGEVRVPGQADEVNLLSAEAKLANAQLLLQHYTNRYGMMMLVSALGHVS